jgi:predicted nucleic acid-binding protein
MASKVFLDANILLDLTLQRADYDVAREIMEVVISGRVQAFVTPSVLHILGYWLTKGYDQARAKDIILALLNDISTIDISHEQVIASLHSSIRNIEDALQYYAALHHKVDYFVSRDKQLRKDAISVLPVYSPEEFLREIRV